MEEWKKLPPVERTTSDGFKFCRQDPVTLRLDCSSGSGGILIGVFGVLTALSLAVVGGLKKEREENTAAYRKYLEWKLTTADGKEKESLEREIHSLKHH